MSTPPLPRRRLRRVRNRLDNANSESAEITPLVRLWTLRLLMRAGGYREFVGEMGFSNDGLATALGLDFGAHPFDDDMGRLLAVRALRELHATSERQDANAPLPEILQSNLDRLGELLGLNETDKALLGFAILLHNEPLLDGAADTLGSLRAGKALRTLASVTDIPEEFLRAALHPQGILAQSCLLDLKCDNSEYLSGKLELLSYDFSSRMTVTEADPVQLLRGSVSAVGPGTLVLSDFRHIQPSLDILCPYLGQVLDTGRNGVNILLHGAPGTGKSELTRSLAAEVGGELFEVATEDEDGDPIHGERRLRAFRAAQRFFAKRKALIVFDECEDVFNDGDFRFGHKSTAQLRKGWVNRTLEDNTAPTLWLSNNIAGIDPAFLRRFDMIIELPVPPRGQRLRIVQEYCGDLVDSSGASRIAASECLAPAVLIQASRIVRTIRGQMAPGRTADALERLISDTLEAQGHRPLLRHDPARLPDEYDPALIHSDADLLAVANGLIAARSGWLCLYGPPGTGKTAFGRWLAERMDMPLLVKCASDLISMWVGGTEANIARAFRQAEAENALLMIDVVDGFLQDRRAATRSWEITQVNELLTRMEAFPGVFVASTNLMHGLDPAALRRFDIKVKFDCLRAPQALDLLRRHCRSIAVDPPGEQENRRLARLPCLTPGDFAAVRRQHRFRPITSAAMLVSRLEAECAIKEGPKRAIGFR